MRKARQGSQDREKSSLRALSPRELQDAGRRLRGWFGPLEWRSADGASRADTARAVHDWIRAAYGLEEHALVFVDRWADEVWGEFETETKDVLLSPKLLLREDPTPLLSALAHENRHAVQYELVEELERREGERRSGSGRPEVDWLEVGWWRDATRRYMPYRTDHWKPYFYSPLEVDAREAVASLVDRGFWAADRGDE